jgi:hypothetical protein
MRAVRLYVLIATGLALCLGLALVLGYRLGRSPATEAADTSAGATFATSQDGATRQFGGAAPAETSDAADGNVYGSVTTQSTASPGPIMVTDVGDWTASWHGMAAGETFDAPPNSLLTGDVKVNGVTLYDNHADTGLVVLLPVGGEISAPWGAAVALSVPTEVQSAFLEDLIIRMFESAGQGGVKTVEIVSIVGLSVDHLGWRNGP